MIVVVRSASIAITGRFQPFHRDHLDLVMHGLKSADRVIIGITNPDRRSLKAVPSSAHRHQPGANPFTYLERQRIIRAALNDAAIDRARYEIVPFPLDAPGVWPDYIPLSTPQLVRVFSDWEHDKVTTLSNGGYAVVVLDGDPEGRISASDVRAAMAAGRPWQHWLPRGSAEALVCLSGKNLQQRCARVDQDP